MQTFSKSERLSKKNLIDQLFAEGHHIKLYPFTFVSLNTEHDGFFPGQVLIHVPKKRIKKAVKRNLIKRRIREAYRLNKENFYQQLNKLEVKLVVAILYHHSEEMTFREIEKKIIVGLNRLCTYYENHPG